MMSTRNYFSFMAAFGAIVLGGGAAIAQTTPSQTVVPPGTQAVIAPNAASSPSHVQVVSPLNGIATASTPGALGEDGLPSLDSAQAGNVAGLTAWCIRHHLSHGTGPRTASRDLAKRADVQNDQYYSLGGKGLLQTGSSTPFDISTLPGDKKVLLCNALFKKAQSLGD